MMNISITRSQAIVPAALAGALFYAISLTLGAASPASATGLSYDEVDNGYSDRNARDAFAQAPPSERRYRNGVSVPVYGPDGRLIGRDPDINVRKQLQDDYWIGKY